VAGGRVGGGGGFNAKRGRWDVSTTWQSFHRETRAVGCCGDVAGGRMCGRRRRDVADGWMAGGGRFNAKRGR